MKPKLDMQKIARGLGAKRRGRVRASGGYTGALALAADIQARFRAPESGGRSTDPTWTERRLVPLTPRTLERLEALAKRVREHGGLSVEPMQLAGLILEKSAEQFGDEVAESLVRRRRRRAIG